MSGEGRDFNNIETRAVIKIFFPLQGKVPKEIHAILTQTSGEPALVKVVSLQSISLWLL